MKWGFATFSKTRKEIKKLGPIESKLSSIGLGKNGYFPVFEKLTQEDKKYLAQANIYYEED